MNPRIKLAAMTALILTAHHANAGEVTNLTTFTAGTPAKAAEVNANFNAVKTAVDDNNTRINSNTADIADHAKRIQDIENAVSASIGALLNQRRGNFTVPEVTMGYTGYIPIAPRIDVDANNREVLSSYTPTVNARAFVQTRCSFDGDSAGQILEHRVAVRTGNNILLGAQYYLGSVTPGPHISVQDVNSDYFDLTAGVAYDFGVYFDEGDTTTTPQRSPTPTPKGGTYKDFCSAVVMIFRR